MPKTEHPGSVFLSQQRPCLPVIMLEPLSKVFPLPARSSLLLHGFDVMCFGPVIRVVRLTWLAMFASCTILSLCTALSLCTTAERPGAEQARLAREARALLSDRCFTMWMAGGGVRPGTVYGATDDFSYNLAENGVHVHDLHATLLHLLGIDHERMTYKYQGRRYRLTDVHGKLVRGMLA
jgi:hypothetical protein